jgi:hypothetical protein
MHALSAYLNGAGFNLRGRPVRDPGESLKVLDVLMRNNILRRGAQNPDSARESRRRLRPPAPSR